MDRMQLKAYAKINLGLDVLRRREDGYHEVKMIMQTIRMYDRLELRKLSGPEIRVRTNLSFLPVNENNLVYKAAKLLLDEFGISQGIAIDLKKFIPVAAGMAGGSSDAAAVLFGVNRMFQLGLGQQELMDRGVKIGADIPYCILRGTALAEGIGERLTSISPMPDCQILIAKPGVNVSTRFVYENLHADQITDHPDVDGMAEALKRQDLRGLAARMRDGNVLERVTGPAYPVIGQIEEFMRASGALEAMMSGSGPTVFGIFEDPAAAKKAYQRLRKRNLARQLYLTSPYNRRTV